MNHPDAKSPTTSSTWSVWRIDDNGNTFQVRGGLEHAEAVRMAEEFTARGHKQMYWVEKDAEPEAISTQP